MPARPLRLAIVAAVLLPAACGGGNPAETPGPAEYVPGRSYFGDGGHVEYVAGDLPLVFAAPHGGTLTPASIPARAAGPACGPEVTTVRDANTEELVREIRLAFLERTGGQPHIVINRLHRSRLDANRAIGEAACGQAVAERAWSDYHGFIDRARSAVTVSHGRGFFTDVHGHGHAIQRLELGYDLSGATLRRTDAELDADPAVERASTIRAFSEASPLAFSALLRGERSLGARFAAAGYPAVPGAQDPAPDEGEPYFSGGYSAERHSCAVGGSVCGVQIEANMAGVRDDAGNRRRFALALVEVYHAYLTESGVPLPALRPAGSSSRAGPPAR